MWTILNSIACLFEQSQWLYQLAAYKPHIIIDITNSRKWLPISKDVLMFAIVNQISNFLLLCFYQMTDPLKYTQPTPLINYLSCI